MLQDLRRSALLAITLLAASAWAQPAAPAAQQPATEEIRAIEAQVAKAEGMRRFGVPKANPKPEGAVRIASYNVLNLFDDQDDPALTGDQDDADMTKPLHERVAVARAIRAVDADILCLQEVESLGAALWFRDQFLSDMGYEHVASLDASDDRGIQQAVLSRHPISHTQTWPRIPLGGVHPDLYGTQPNWNAGEPLELRRAPMRADVEIPGPGGEGTQTLTFFVVHHKSGRHSGYWREAEARAVLGMAQEVMKAHPDRPVLIAGDFNALPTDESVQTYLRAGFHDIFAKHRQDNSIITHESGRRIDMILANAPAMAQLQTEQAFVLGTAARPVGIDWRDIPTFPGMASDHYPVVVDAWPSGVPQTIPAGG